MSTPSKSKWPSTDAPFTGTLDEWLELNDWMADQKREMPGNDGGRQMWLAIRVRGFLENFCSDVTKAVFIHGRHAQHHYYMQQADVVVTTTHDAATANKRRAVHVNATAGNETPVTFVHRATYEDDNDNRPATTYDDAMLMVLVKVDAAWNRLLGCYVYHYGDVKKASKSKEPVQAAPFQYIDFSQAGWHTLLAQTLTDQLKTALVYKAPPFENEWVEVSGKDDVERKWMLRSAMCNPCGGEAPIKVVKRDGTVKEERAMICIARPVEEGDEESD